MTAVPSGRSCGEATRRVGFVDLVSQRKRLKGRIDRAISDVLCDCHFTSGPQVELLEAELRRWADAEHAITCGSGTDALLRPDL